MSTSLLPALEICKGVSPQASVIWLHGLGADGHDFAPVIEQLNIPHVRFILPHAPSLALTINGGQSVPAWFDLTHSDLAAREDAAGIHASEQAILRLIERENVRGIPANKIVLAGFSQGGAIALHTGLHSQQRLAGILALSTWLPLQAELTTKSPNINQSLPVFIGHGKNDSVVPFIRAQQARYLLIKLGYAVTDHNYDMAHSVCLEEILDIQAWLKGVLNTF